MSVSQEQRERVMAQAQGAVALEIAFIGVANGLLSQLDRLRQATADQLAIAAGFGTRMQCQVCE